MKKMKKLMGVLLVVCSMLLLVACGGKSEDKLVGTWQDSMEKKLRFMRMEPIPKMANMAQENGPFSATET